MPPGCILDVFMNRDPRFALSQEVEAKQTLLERRSARVTLTTIPALIMRAWTASADLGIVRMNQTTSTRRHRPLHVWAAARRTRAVGKSAVAPGTLILVGMLDLNVRVPPRLQRVHEPILVALL